MGFRFRKSFKIAPGIKWNLNKKSSSITFGGKGIHHTINSKGQTTDSIGVPRTGIYYTKTTKKGNSSDSSIPPTQDIPSYSGNNNGDKKKRGCLFYFLMLVVICIALAFLPLLWLPAIGFIIYFALKKDEPKTKRRNILISSLILIVSIIAFVNFDTSASLTQIEAEWDKETYDVSENATVNIIPTPSDASVSSLELSDEKIADVEYSDGKAILTFKKSGNFTLYFIADNNITSNRVQITVTDEAAERAAAEAQAEEQARAQALAEEQARAQALAEEQARAQALAEEQARAQALAEEQARAKAQTEEQARIEEQTQIQSQPQQQAAPSQSQATQSETGGTVYWTPNGEVYHSTPDYPSLGRSKTILSGTIAQSGKSRPCKNCY